MSHSWRLCISLITCHTAQMREDAEVMAWLQAAWLGFWTHQAALLAVRWWNGIPKYWSSRSKLAQEEVWFYHSGGKNHEEPVFHIVLRCFGKPGAPTKRGVLVHRLHRVHRVHRGDETRWAGRRGIRKALATWHRSGTASVRLQGIEVSGSTRYNHVRLNQSRMILMIFQETFQESGLVWKTVAT